MSRPIRAKVVKRQKYSDIDFDMFSTCKWLTDEGERRLLAVFNRCRDRLIEAGQSPKTLTIQFGHCSGVLRNVPKGEAETIREQVEVILNDPSCVYVPEHLQ